LAAGPCQTVHSPPFPNDPANRDRVEYDEWLADGGVPDPYVPAARPAPDPLPEDVVLYDHENRLRELEGVPPLTPGEFKAAARALMQPKKTQKRGQT
jgi:hypothetical protein